MPYFGILGKEAYHVNKHIEQARLLDWLNGSRKNLITWLSHLTSEVLPQFKTIFEGEVPQSVLETAQY